VLFADLDSIFEYRSVTTLTVSILTWLMVKSINSSCYLLNESAVDQLSHLEVAAAVRTLLSLLGEPFPDAVTTAELGARRTEDGVLDLAVADETLEDLLDVLVGIGLILFTAAVGINVLLNYATSVRTLNGANVSESLASWTMVKRVGH
jgi:hypothetical protein